MRLVEHVSLSDAVNCPRPSVYQLFPELRVVCTCTEIRLARLGQS